MIVPKMRRVIVFAVLSACLSFPVATGAQTPSPRPGLEEANLDIQLYLIQASNKEGEDGKVPAALAPVIKQLRESLTFRHFNLAATFVNRVKNNAKLEVSWIGGPLTPQGGSVSGNQIFSELTAFVKLFADEGNREIVRLSDFRFGTRIPIVTGPGGAINYQHIGLRTDLSLREGSPVVAGTLYVGSSGEALVVALSARRAN